MSRARSSDFHDFDDAKARPSADSHTLGRGRFLRRRKVLTLYKNLLKVVKILPDKKDQEELHDWVRKDFKSNMGETDEMAVNMKISYGEKSLENLKRMIKQSK
ncbi:unnamed protein product [Darwinula stevensoni]|uniref:LYR motif-containing protein 2 n=1 Tax=Darwinula stevensoni TaxID=69355 RepID=A0A7R9A2Y8_9CRUS|nr:unnamed protein product [Darwinula stevensoni]CAG0890696.1 unnamed protein product [Darwinula stevensoni]